MKSARRPTRAAVSLLTLLALPSLIAAVPLFTSSKPAHDAHAPGQHAVAAPTTFLDDDLTTDLTDSDFHLFSKVHPQSHPTPPQADGPIRRLASRFLGSQRVLRSLNPDSQLSMSQNALSQHSNDIVLRFTIDKAEDREKFMEAASILFLDVWSITPTHIDVLLPQPSLTFLLDLLPPSLRTAHTALIPDLRQAMLSTYPQFTPTPPTNTNMDPEHSSSGDTENVFFSDYQPLSTITKYLKLLQSLHPTITDIITIGRAHSGRRILALRVGNKLRQRQASGRHPRKTIVINGGSHAREWISTSTVLYLAHTFTTGYVKDKEIRELVDEFDWVFIPSLNTDGYVYTWESDRLWRKNRMETGIGFCQGVDLDRAFGVEWRGGGNPCADNYQGEAPFSAPEARGLADWAVKLNKSGKGKIVGFLDFHSYSQQVLYPYSHSCKKRPLNRENLEELAHLLAKSIRSASAETYTIGSACDASGFSASSPEDDHDNGLSGSAIDWFHAKANVPYSYQIKLRDTGSYGFLLPREMIVPTGREMVGVVRTLGGWLLERDEGGWRDELKRKDL
ncbi:hypothetical protein BJ508DRAFT_420067 [Ascobolus immersus RN42]|uniref:Inactive metallocarboxypeptidase ECM14 n=1 Tax=Ascobolus immersus RN42 TaxID=1160509 RepID=A0A3N4HFP5_ASCIM|nr:hypothetical protein BJ508DRAFT_420067 [Ascobolus immersus RN42]